MLKNSKRVVGFEFVFTARNELKTKTEHLRSLISPVYYTLR